MTGRSRTLARVSAGRLCAGCGACASIAPGKIVMQRSQDGFLRPKQRAALCVDEEQTLSAVCPGIGVSKEASAGADDPFWGPVRAIEIGHAADAELRFNGASGGALSAMLMFLLRAKYVDEVLHVGPDPTRPTENRMFLSHTRESLVRNAASRYAPSSPLSVVSALLESESRFAFVGKPCDVAALRALARIDARVDERFPVMLSFFCAGTPSSNGAIKIARSLGIEKDRIAGFRYRGKGWPGETVVRSDDDRTGRMSYNDSWGRILSGLVQPRCKICADGVGATADIVFADAWHCDPAGYPDFAEADGQSLILARTNLGERLLVQAKLNAHIVSRRAALDQLAAMQPGQHRRKRVLAARLLALAVLFRPRPRYRGLGVWQSVRAARPGELLRNFVGMGRRVLTRQM